MKLGGLGGNPKDLGIEVSKTLFAPRLGAAYRLNDNTVFRAGYGRTFNPLPWSRPMRGLFPLTIAYSDAGPNGFIPYGNLANGIGRRRTPTSRAATCRCRAAWPCGRPIRTTSIAARRTPGTPSSSAGCRSMSPSVSAMSARATNGGYADLNLNYAERGGKRSDSCSRRRAPPPSTCSRRSSKARYHSLQMALNRPFKNGLLLKGAYTLSKAMNEGDDDGAGYSWAQPSQFDRNYALAGYDRPHMLQMGFVYELPFGRGQSGVVAAIIKNWQINGIGSWLSGTPFTVGGDNGLLQQQGGMQTANVTGDPEPASARRDRTSRGTTRPRSASRATPGATAAATRSAVQATGTSISRCSGPSPSVTTAWSSAPSRRTSSTTRSGATR